MTDNVKLSKEEIEKINERRSKDFRVKVQENKKKTTDFLARKGIEAKVYVRYDTMHLSFPNNGSLTPAQTDELNALLYA